MGQENADLHYGVLTGDDGASRRTPQRSGHHHSFGHAGLAARSGGTWWYKGITRNLDKKGNDLDLQGWHVLLANSPDNTDFQALLRKRAYYPGSFEILRTSNGLRGALDKRNGLQVPAPPGRLGRLADPAMEPSATTLTP